MSEAQNRERAEHTAEAAHIHARFLAGGIELTFAQALDMARKARDRRTHARHTVSAIRQEAVDRGLVNDTAGRSSTTLAVRPDTEALLREWYETQTGSMISDEEPLSLMGMRLVRRDTLIPRWQFEDAP